MVDAAGKLGPLLAQFIARVNHAVAQEGFHFMVQLLAKHSNKALRKQLARE